MATGIRTARRAETIESGSPGHPARISIGTYTLAEDREFTETYETAAWWSKVLVPAGVFEVTTNGYYAFVRLEGTVTSKYTASLYGGRPLSLTTGNPGPAQYENHRDVGSASTISMQPYLYNVAEMFADPDNATWTPWDGIECVITGWADERIRTFRDRSEGTYRSSPHPFFDLVDHRGTAGERILAKMRARAAELRASA